MPFLLRGVLAADKLYVKRASLEHDSKAAATLVCEEGADVEPILTLAFARAGKERPT